MISASADLATAVASAEHAPIFEVFADWHGEGYGGASATQGTSRYVLDRFDRVTDSSLGVALTGEAWGQAGGNTTDYSTNGAVARHLIGATNASRRSFIGNFADVDVSVEFSYEATPTGADVRASAIARYLDTSNHYIAWAVINTTGVVDLLLQKVVGGTTTTLQSVTTTGVTFAANTQYGVRLQVQGSTVRAMVWDVDNGRPVDWQASVVDTGLTLPGSVGMRSIRTSGNTNGATTVIYDNFRAVDLTYVDDLTPRVASITIDRSLTGDSPEEVRAVEGSATAQLSVELVAGEHGDERQTAAWFYSPYNVDSPMGELQRHNVPIYAEIGAVTAAGPELLRRFTGRTSSRPISAGNGRAMIYALDGRDGIRRHIDLPMALSWVNVFIQPGLNSQWVADYILRQNGYYSTPPVRDRCALSVTYRGSANPEVGRLNTGGFTSWYDAVVDADFPCRFVAGQAGYALAAGTATDLHGTEYLVDATYPTGMNDGENVFIQFWVYVYPGVASPQWIVQTRSFGFNPAIQIDIADIGATSRVGVLITRSLDGTGSFTATGSEISGSPRWIYVGVHCEFTSSGCTTRVRTEGTTNTTFTATASQSEAPRLYDAGTLAQHVIEGLQITSEPYSATMWDNAFVPTAYLDAKGTNELTAIVAGTSGDSWDLLAELAGAEYAMFGFPEDETAFRWHSRARWVETEAQTQQRSLTAVADVRDLDVDDGVPAIRNSISVPAAPVIISDVQEVWTASESYMVPARGSLVVWAQFASAVADVESYPWFGDPATNGEFSTYSANTKPDGAGTNVSQGQGVSITYEAIFANSMKLRLVNNRSAAVWFVDTTGAAAIRQVGRSVTQEEQSAAEAVAESPSSIGQYGYRPLAVPTNRWRQSNSMADGLAGDLLGELAQPRPTIKGLRIIGDPRLQLGDRVGLEVLNALGLSGDYWLTAIRDEFDSSGYHQVLTCRAATVVLLWDVGTWDNFVWGA